MQILILVDFGGVETGEKRILPGIYHYNDPALFGLAGYLVEGGWAKVVADRRGRSITNELQGAIALGELLATERIEKKTGATQSIDDVTVTELIAESIEELKEGEIIEVDLDDPVEGEPVKLENTEIERMPETSIHGLGIPTPTLKALTEAGVHSVEQIASMSDEELLEIEGIGHQTVRKLRSLTAE